MEELETLKKRLETERPVEWDALPDISLYMDQVIGYMPRQLIQYEQGDALTSAMVNNYIKDGLLPRAEGKRYSRIHLAYLTAICALKQVLPVREAGHLVGARGAPPEELYESFRGELDKALSDTAAGLDTDCTQEDLPRLALGLAMRSYADKLACERVLSLMGGQDERAEKPKKSKEKSHE